MKPVFESATVLTPGKIILCGEHAAVHGLGAFVQSLPLFTQVEIKAVEGASKIHIQSELGSLQGLWQRGQPLTSDSRWKWLEYLFQTLDIDLTRAFELTITSELKMGSGMGSSAAVIVGVLVALKRACEIQIDQDKAFAVAKEAEAHCHGKSSGLDLAASLWGGRFKFQQGKITRLTSTKLEGVYIYFSGKPESSTQVCVEHTSELLLKNHQLLDQMLAILQAFELALEKGDWELQKRLIQKWHQLLVILGVVPEGIQRLVESIERRKGAAKISGAGSLQGLGAGWMLIWADERLAQELQSEGLALKPLQAPCRGAWRDEA